MLDPMLNRRAFLATAAAAGAARGLRRRRPGRPTVTVAATGGAGHEPRARTAPTGRSPSRSCG